MVAPERGLDCARLLVTSLVLLFAGLAGCAKASGEAEGLMLDDLQACELRWADAAPAPCKSNLPELAVDEGFPPAPWVCLRGYQHNGAELALYWRAQDGRYAIAADLRGEPGVPLGMVRDGGEPRLLWRPTPGVSHVVLPPDHGDLQQTAFTLTSTTLDSDDPRLDGRVSVDVVARAGEHAPVVHVEDRTASYHLSPLGPGMVGYGRFTFFGAIGSDTYLFSGEDFDARLDIQRSGDFWMVSPLTPTCNA